jgi:hypothetical protein
VFALDEVLNVCSEKNKHKERRKEREKLNNIYGFLSQTESGPVPLHFQEIFTIITKDYKCSSKQARDF